MTVFQQVKNEAQAAHWHYSPYTGGFGANAPTSTYSDLVNLAFENVSKTMNHARHCSLHEMYTPALGEFRRRKMYTSLAPSLCIPHISRVWRSDESEFPAYNSYKTKQTEWQVEKDRNRPRFPSRYPIQPTARSISEPNLHPARNFLLPTQNTRFENVFLYDAGKRRGARIASPFFNYEDYAPMEQRRYHRLFWAREFINLLPSCRHSRALMLSAY